jgi:hypothetical protein
MRLKAHLGTTAGLSCALGLTLSLASLELASAALACSPPLNARVLLDNGATIPADGVIAFEKASWDLSMLLADEASPPDASPGWFYARDVVSLQTAGGVDVPGTLTTVASYIVFRPKQPLAAGA